MDVFLSTRTIVKTYGPVGVPMVMVSEGTDQMDKSDIQRAPTISEDGLQPNSPARLSALLLWGGGGGGAQPIALHDKYIRNNRGGGGAKAIVLHKTRLTGIKVCEN